MEENKKENLNKSEIALNEEKVLEFWNKSKTFEKSEEKNVHQEGEETPNDKFVFYDGPPFATGLPHYGHILAGTIKDAIPRYQTMKGKKVKRMWGWDCHGLPLENIIEEELGLGTKKDIENYGIEKFNSAASSKVLYYADDWGKIIPRMGRWIDMSSPYRTMDTSYTESVWWSFKEIYKKGLIEENFKSMHYCPRCGTTLSNFEVNQGYKDIKDFSVTVEFELEDSPGTFVLAWTTTPWTLPGNMALAVNPKETYIKIEKKNEENGKLVRFILAKCFLEKFFGNDEYKIIEEFDGVKLVGKKYKPVFDSYLKENFSNNPSVLGGKKENAWKIWGANFVTTEEGTGVVHIAPAFGEDDLALAQKENIPIVQHVDLNGKFKKEVKEFAGVLVKAKNDPKLSAGQGHQATDIEIIKYLANKGVLFAKEKVEHSYPHCWRCDTPLLNYATSSWFLKTTKIKEKIINENQKIKWVPENIRDGRMGKWLEGMRDWAISRSRYWGAPLPVWKCEKCDNKKVIGSIQEIKEEKKSTNKYFIIRHGQAENNIQEIYSSSDLGVHPLTEKGREQILKSSKGLKNNPNLKDGQGKIDLIISSPFLRTKQSAEILAQELNIPKILFDDRLGEKKFGELDAKKHSESGDWHSDYSLQFKEAPKEGETLKDLKRRVFLFLKEIDSKYKNKKILFVTHETPFWMLVSSLSCLNQEQSLSWLNKNKGIDNGEYKEFDFYHLPHNNQYELDLHRPYIDEVQFKCNCGGEMKIIKEVFDCWYESGSMPFASKHYPFENKDVFDPKKGIGYPADFIAEGLDQTRGWFYSMLVLSVALFDKTAYQNVIVNGLVLAEDGQKMSKSKKNFPDVTLVINKYGADALRYYLLASPLMKAEDLNFTERGVDEVLKKNILRFKNVLSFYELYKEDKKENFDPMESPVLLDKWILAKIHELSLSVSENLDNFEIDKAARPITDFVEDLSTWYLRRSRNRFKFENQKDKDFAIATTKYVLENLAKIYAPFMPFVAEEIWQKVTENNFEKENKSVHLEEWFEGDLNFFNANATLLNEMDELRKIVSIGLEIRAREGIKVRQPLQKLLLQDEKITKNKDFCNLLKEELNVKEVLFFSGMEDKIELDLGISLALQREGDFRELLRNIQILRKEKGLQAQDQIILEIESDEEGEKLINEFNEDLRKVAGVKQIDFKENSGKEIKINDYLFKVLIVAN